MHRAFVRSALIDALSGILAWAFIATLCREVAHAFWYAQNDVRIELNSFRDLWRSA